MSEPVAITELRKRVEYAKEMNERSPTFGNHKLGVFLTDVLQAYDSAADSTGKYYIDRMWEEYHKMKEELASTKCKLGQAEDYINETLTPELANSRIKLKMAQSAWDELDKSHVSRATLHDELVIAEGQRDQWKMKYEAAVEYNLRLRAYNESLVPLIEAAQELENSYHDIYVVNKVRRAVKNLRK